MALDQVRQFLRLHRLVQVQVAPMSDLAQGDCRDVAGENDRWDLVIESLPQPSDDFDSKRSPARCSDTARALDDCHHHALFARC